MLDAQIARLRDRDSHRRLSREALIILTRDFGCKSGEVVWMFEDNFVTPRDGSYGAYGDKLRAAFMNGEISEEDFRQIWQAGFIARGVLASDGSEAWFVGEPSGGRRFDAIYDSRRRAAVVARFEGAPAHPFIYCFNVSERERKLAAEYGVRVIRECVMR